MQLSALTSAVWRFVSELQRRKVIRVAAGYAVVGWIVLQVALALQTAMKLPEAFSTVIVSLLIVGFPIALVASWLFEFTPDGIKRTGAAGDGALVKPQTTDLILAGALVIVMIVALMQLLASGPVSSTAPLVAESKPPKVEPPALGDKSIAVLPFANLSPDKENEYFADGLTEEILNIVAQMRSMKVVSRTSSFAFKGKGTPLPEIAKRLGVRHILEGSVRRSGDDIRVTAQLIDVATDVHVWSQTFERKLDDIFVVQDDIARAIAGALNIEVAVSAGGREAPTKNMEAYRLFLSARELYFRRRGGDLLESVELYKRAIELDPKFAEAHAAVASCYAVFASASASANKEFAPKAQQAVATALALKPNIGRAFGVLAALARLRLDWNGVITNYSKAIAIDPSDSVSLGGLGVALLFVGKFEEGNSYINEAKRIDPIYNFITAPIKLLSALMRGDDDTSYSLAAVLVASSQAGAQAKSFGHGVLTFQALAKGDSASAEKHLRAMLKLLGRDDSVINAVIPALKSRAALGAAEKALQAEAVRDPSFEPEPVYLAMRNDAAYFDALTARLARGDTARTAAWMPYMWRSYARSENARLRFKAFVRAAGFVDYWKKHGWPDKCRPKGEDDFECS